MKKIAVVVGLVVVALLMVSLTPAADAPASPYTIVRSLDLIGKTVKNRSGTVLGKVEDYVINIKDGTITYGVVLYGDTLGFGGKLFAVPPQALSLADDQKAVVIDAEKDDFDKAAGFDANKWPTEPDSHWGKKGTPPKDPKKDDPKKDDPKKDDPKKDDEKTTHLRRVTSLMGTSVRNTKGEDIGSIQGLVFSQKDNKVLYAAMNYGGVAGIGGKYFAVPWEALSLQSPTLKAGDRVFILDATKDQLERATGFDTKAWPLEADKQFSKGGTKEPPKP